MYFLFNILFIVKYSYLNYELNIIKLFSNFELIINIFLEDFLTKIL